MRKNSSGLTASSLWAAVQNLIDIVAGTALVVSALCAFVGVLTRYVFEVATWWVFPIQHYTYIYVILLGAALASRRKIHVRVEIIEDLLKERFVTRTVLRLVLQVLALVMACCFTYYAYDFMMWVWHGEQADTVLTWLPLGVVKSLIFVLGLLLIAYLIRDIRANVNGLKSRRADTDKGDSE